MPWFDYLVTVEVPTREGAEVSTREAAEEVMYALLHAEVDTAVEYEVRKWEISGDPGGYGQ